VESNKQDGVKDRVLYSQLKEGISDLTKMKANADANVAHIEEEIRCLQLQMEQIKGQEAELLRIVENCGSESSSHRHSRRPNSLDRDCYE
jgi:hypothetical protein